MAERNYAFCLRSYRRSVVALRKTSQRSNFLLGTISPVLLVALLSLIYSRLNIDFELHWDVLLVESFLVYGLCFSQFLSSGKMGSGSPAPAQLAVILYMINASHGIFYYCRRRHLL